MFGMNCGCKFGPQLNGNLIKMVVTGDGFWWHWAERAQINSSVDIGDFFEACDTIRLRLTDANGFDLMWVKCNFIITSWYQIAWEWSVIAHYFHTLHKRYTENLLV